MTTLMRKTTRTLWLSLLITAVMVSISSAAVPSGDAAKNGKRAPASYRITSVNWEQSAEEYSLRIKGGSAPTYTMYELFEPLRVIIDVADASLETSAVLPFDLHNGPVSRVSGKVLADKTPSIARIELFLNEEHDYTVVRTENEIVVRFPTSPTDRPTNATPTVPVVKSAGASGSSVSSDLGVADTPGSLTDENISSLVDTTQATKVIDIVVSKDPHATKVYLKADGPITNYKKVLLERNTTANRPDRMYLDLKNLRLGKPFETRSIGTAALDKIRTAKRQDGFRIVFDSGLDQLFDYSIDERPDGLLVTIKEPSSAITPSAPVQEEDIVAQDMQQQEIDMLSALQGTAETPLSPVGVEGDSEPPKPSLSSATVIDGTNFDERAAVKRAFKAPTPQDMTFAGYNKQRITVDFYKIDLHNVFRLFGEISNLNIVVDEGVGGSLTLALNDVPWDFALDIILNLKDLQKEERFNTIVISPKSKLFRWPERALDNVEFKSDIKIEQAEQADGGLKISKRLDVPETVVAAKKLIHQANISERKGDFTTAISLYEEAFSKWSDNINLAKRIAALCLVNVEQNAKAVHYARTTLKLSPGDNDAALQAAIGLARMKKTAEAKEFFDISVTGDKPASEALSSYSSFCEEQMDYTCSLAQLKRHEELHGDTLDTMLSKARIYDKQGKQDLAAKEYRTILLSGYDIPPDLARYVKGRAALAGR